MNIVWWLLPVFSGALIVICSHALVTIKGVKKHMKETEKVFNELEEVLNEVVESRKKFIEDLEIIAMHTKEL